jgi:hypothetical protein
VALEIPPVVSPESCDHGRVEREEMNKEEKPNIAIRVIRFLLSEAKRKPTFWDIVLGWAIVIILISIMCALYIKICSHSSGLSN